ncbi:MAG: SpoIIE family protein phosphatase [Thermoanaerobaculia bacterium]|nr:SpoIIE family protein phosphatase [Thermoanaerobaculia bacterium]
MSRPSDGSGAGHASKGAVAEPQTNLEREVERLSRAVSELSTLNDLARAIGASLDVEQVMRTIVARSLRALDAEEGVITLAADEQSSSLRTLVREVGSSLNVEAFHFKNALLGWMQIHRMPLLVNDPPNDERFRGVEWEATIRSLIAVPLVVKGKLTGVLTVYNKKGGAPFDTDDQRLLAIIGSQSAQIVENARLHDEELKLAKIREQVQLAAEVQRHLLPQPIPRIEGFDIHGTNVAAELVGGDYFDVVPVDAHRWLVCVGDVSGKGLPASLLMANVQAMIQLMAMLQMSPDSAMRHANTLLCRSTPDTKFVTFFTSIVDSASGLFEFCNAGHNPPLFVTADGRCERLASSGAALGMLETLPYSSATRTMATGDCVVIYSDGVTEAINAGDEEFGEEQLAALVVASRERPASAIVAAILGAVRAHAGGHPQSDDITIVVLKRLGAA